jgi:hypothetical protein
MMIKPRGITNRDFDSLRIRTALYALSIIAIAGCMALFIAHSVCCNMIMDTISFFLPARKGSQRVKNKNTRPFAGIQGVLLENKLNRLLTRQLLFWHMKTTRIV